jgi:hypothetical protein
LLHNPLLGILGPIVEILIGARRKTLHGQEAKTGSE